MPLMDALFARLYDPMMSSMERHGFTRERARLLADARGDVVELGCLLYTSPSPRDLSTSRMPSSA